jgi:2-phospho-L-lactate guanylyltransferase
MIWAIVPVKPLLLGKSRLAAAMAPDARAALNRNLLENTLKVIGTADGIDQTLVTSRDPEALAIAREFGARTLLEESAAQLNGALERATLVARAVSCRAVLVLPADLPLLSAEDVHAFLNELNGAPAIAIAPDRHESGTNGLMVAPPSRIAYRFGPSSFQEHTRLALETGARLSILRRPSLALDLDLPEDLALLQDIRSGSAGDWDTRGLMPSHERPKAGEAI